MRLWMDSFWREGKNDGSTRERFFEAGGFCREHALLLRELARGERGGAAIADVYRWLMKGDAELLGRASGKLARRHQRLRLQRNVSCPACDATAAATERKLSFLVDALAGSTIRARYAASDGLCVPHLLQAISQTSGEEPEICQFLLDDGRRRLADLGAALDEFDRKRDARYRDEPKGAEQLAPARAIERYVGELGTRTDDASTGEAR
jgi:hypothetical protein